MIHSLVHVLILNYNGRRWLDLAVPSAVAAACEFGPLARVTVVDNSSSDGSGEYVRSRWPCVGLVIEPNLGLASFNAVLSRISEPYVLLLNNDVTLDRGAIGPLVAALSAHDDALFSAPQCWTPGGETYEGMRTRVRMRYGLVQGISRVDGYEDAVERGDLTASAGPVLAVKRREFLEMGGYDPIYFPGRIEDLDLGFRAWMAGMRGYYVPESRASHVGFGTFSTEVGTEGSDRLALRNTCVFMWKNVAGARMWRHLGWLPIRFARALATGRWHLARAMIDALRMVGPVVMRRRRLGVGEGDWVRRQEAFFARFAD